MDAIKKLSKSVQSKLESGVTITNVVQCVMELVYNALDADATCIAVRVDLRKFYVQVIDNGKGLTKVDLDRLGKRHMTSKINSLNDLESVLPSFGYRGCAIASIIDSCGSVEFQTRPSGTSQTFIKVIKKGTSNEIIEKQNYRPVAGTSVIVSDLLVTMPVRQKKIKEVFDIEGIKEGLESLSVIFYKVSFSLRNDATGKILLQSQKHDNVIITLNEMFSLAMQHLLLPINHTVHNLSVTGFVSKQLNSNSSLQFVFVNDRIIDSCSIHKLVINLLEKFSGFWNEDKENSQIVDIDGFVFIIKIRCPYPSYTMHEKGRKRSVEFRDEKSILKAVYNAVKEVLKNNSDLKNVPSNKKIVLTPKEQGNPEFGPSQLRHAVFGRKASKILQNQSELLLVKQASSQILDKNRKTPSFQTIENYQQAFFHESGDGTALALNAPIFEIPDMPQVSFHEFLAWLKVKSTKSSTVRRLLEEFLVFKAGDAHHSTAPILFQKPPSMSLKEIRREKLAMRSRFVVKRVGGNFDSEIPQKKIIKLNEVKRASSAAVKESVEATVLRNPVPCQSLDFENLLKDESVLCTWKSHYRDKPSSRNKKKIRNVLKSPLRIDHSANKPPLRTRSISEHDHGSVKRMFEFHNITELSSLKINSPSEISAVSISSNNHEIVNNKTEILNNHEESKSTNGKILQKTKGVQACVIAHEKSSQTLCVEKISAGVQSSKSSNIDISVQTNTLNVKNAATTTKDLYRKMESNPKTDDFENSDTYHRFLAQVESAMSDSVKGSLTEIQCGQNVIRSQIPGTSDDLLPEALRMIGLDSSDREEIPVTKETAMSCSNIEEIQDTVPKTNETVIDCNNEVNIHDPQPKINESEWAKHKTADGRTFFMHSISGFTTFEPPISSTKFSFVSTDLPFVPVPESVGVIAPLPRSGRDELHAVLMDTHEEFLTDIKWGNNDSGIVSKPDFLKGLCDANQKAFDIPGIASAVIGKPGLDVHRLLASHKFNRESISGAKVLGQLDKKFIVALVKKPRNHIPTIICVFDQHAVHERILLNSLLEQYRIENTFISEPVEPNVIVKLSSGAVDVVKEHSKCFEVNGLLLTVAEGDTVTVKTAPLCFLKRQSREIKSYRGSSLQKLIENLISEILEYIKDTRGVVLATPKTIMGVIASEACRGAIKFNHALTYIEMDEMLQQLEKCQLPFQCAHGRPSVVPILDLDDSNSSKEPFGPVKLNLKKFKTKTVKRR